MTRKINLKLAKFPALLGTLTESNQYLKVIAALSCVTSLGMVVVLFYLSARAPVIFALSAVTAEELPILQKPPDPEREIRAAISQYLMVRYRWTPKDVKERLEQAGAFILPTNFKSFQVAVDNVQRFSLEKLVAQRVFPEKIDVSLEKKTVRITGDRITEIQGLKAAGSLRLELSFESGPRTRSNPWGVYITKEREEM